MSRETIELRTGIVAILSLPTTEDAQSSLLDEVLRLVPTLTPRAAHELLSEVLLSWGKEHSPDAAAHVIRARAAGINDTPYLLAVLGAFRSQPASDQVDVVLAWARQVAREIEAGRKTGGALSHETLKHWASPVRPDAGDDD
ncbi:MAG: hypothetical protein NXI30_04690 [bacterium]|nr:hypothetical protein [bacterium]